MSRFFARLSYDGQAYHGWQRQPNALTVQEVLEVSLSTILRSERIPVTGCGRTDTGVHARNYYMHLELPASTDTKTVLFRWNQILPHDIAVHELVPIHDKAHARFDATAREYRYYVHQKKDPFLRGRSHLICKDLDMASMSSAALLLIGKKDFSAFARSHSDNKSDICDVRIAQWERQGHRLIFSIEADRFLRNMVRAIVGTLLEVGEGKKSQEDFQRVLDSKDRSQAGTSAPAHGLYLNRIDYPYLQPHGE